MRLGQIEIHMLTDGLFRLDGGSMFGIVPKPLWEKTNPPDEKNRIRMNLGVLLIRANGKNILVDTGAGGKLDSKWRGIYALPEAPGLEAALAKLRLTPDDIDIVINTHLHFDHAGGNTFKRLDGQIVPLFSNARYFVQKGEWDWANTQHERTQYAYFKDDFTPLERSGRLTLLKGDEEIVRGVCALVAPGHTEHHQCVTIESENRKAIFLGDLIPMTAHLPYPYIMGYDLFPLRTLETKKKILQQAQDGHWILIFQHDPEISMGTLKTTDGKLSLEVVHDTEG